AEIKVNDPKSALIYSFNKTGVIDVALMSEKSGIDRTTLIDKLHDYIVFNPSIKNYELKPVFLNNNLYETLNKFDIDAENNLTNQEKQIYKSELARTRREILLNIPEVI